MKIYAIDVLDKKNNHVAKVNEKQKFTKTYSNNNNLHTTLYYVDYNLHVNFKGGRDPQDFYEFNNNKMPITMQNYLNENREERLNLAPIQLMQEAYEYLQLASNVNDIKEMYPEEKNFAELKPANYKTAKNGILKRIKEVKELSDVQEPLFKDGNDDLTTYIVKKIYYEGKTLKEIDSDFAKEINPIYELIARPLLEKQNNSGNTSVFFTASTTYNLGIRFPELSFWNSFINTRNDYKIIKRVKTSSGQFVNADSQPNRETTPVKQHIMSNVNIPKKKNLDRHRVKHISDIIANSKGNINKAIKEINKKAKNTEELSFLQRFWSPIMIYTLEKIHLSEELINFYEGRKNNNIQVFNIVDKIAEGESLSEKEITPLQIFWDRHPVLKKHFSTTLSDTILLFSEKYGIDGQNEEFEELLEYTYNIKPHRILKRQEHDFIQAEYDKLAIELSNSDKPKETPDNVVKIKDAIEPDFKIDKNNIPTGNSLKRENNEAFRKLYSLLPKQYVSKSFEAIDLYTDSKRLWATLHAEQISDPELKSLVYSKEEMQPILKEHRIVMDNIYSGLTTSSKTALFLYAYNNQLMQADEYYKLLNMNERQVEDMLSENLLVDKETAAKEIQHIFDGLGNKLTNKDINSIRIKLLEHVRSEEYKNINFSPEEDYKMVILEVIQKLLSENEYKYVISRMFSSYMFTERLGTAVNILFDKNIDKTVKNEFMHFVYDSLINIHWESILMLLEPFPESYNKVKQALLKNAQTNLKFVR